jgi:hypothetical protein
MSNVGIAQGVHGDAGAGIVVVAAEVGGVKGQRRFRIATGRTEETPGSFPYVNAREERCQPLQ